jgi:hypothetical protein
MAEMSSAQQQNVQHQITGKIVGTIAGLGELYQRSERADAARSAAIQAEQRKLTGAWTDTWAAAQVLSNRMAARYFWANGEYGFDGYRSKGMLDQVTRRPRDPFIKAAYAANITGKEKPDELLSRADMCLDASGLTPVDSLYQTFRDDYLGCAGDLALWAASNEAGTLGYTARPSSAPRALRVVRTYLAAAPRDSSGRGHALLARALAFSGRYQEAVQAAATAYNIAPNLGDNQSFCYRYSMLLSVAGAVDLAGSWLGKAYADGFDRVDLVRTDPSFENLRSGRPRQFQEMTTPKVAVSIQFFQLLPDDILIKNQSPFNLTNVVVKARIRKGDQVWTPVIKAQSIKAGTVYKATNATYIAGNSYDEFTYTLECDQCPR